MTRDEAGRICAAINMLWPHSNLGDDAVEVVTVWHSFLQSFHAGEVEAAIRDLAAQGREHAPPVGVVVKTVTERVTDTPDWDQVRAEALRAVTTYRPPRGLGDPYAAPPAGYWSHPLIAGFMDGAWNEWRMAGEMDGTFNAQQREAWKALAARAQRGAALAAVGAPRRRGGLQRPDYLAALPGPEAA